MRDLIEGLFELVGAALLLCMFIAVVAAVLVAERKQL